jgi:hypothetical protein
MINGVMTVRLDAARVEMVNKLRIPGERDSAFLMRAIDALALTDENLQVILGEEDYGV